MKKLFCAIFALASVSLFAGAGDYKTYLGMPDANKKFLTARSLGIKYLSFQRNGIWHLLRKDIGDDFCYYLKDPEMFACAAYPPDAPDKAHPNHKTHWRELCALIDANAPFPQNFAHGRQLPSGDIFLLWNYQRKRVVDFAVARIMATLKSMEKSKSGGCKMKFGGFIFTDPRLSGEFYARAADGTFAKTALPNGTALSVGKPLDYKTYSEGRLEFFKALRKAVRAVYPDAKFVFETSDIRKDFLEYAESVPDFKAKYADAIPDLVVSRGGVPELLREENFKSGILSRGMVVSASLANAFDPAREAAEIAALAVCGAGSIIDIDSPECGARRWGNIPARLRVSRMIPAMENLNNTPLEARRYDAGAGEYSSPTAFISAKGAGFLAPNTNKFFITFIEGGGRIKLPDGYTVDTFEYVNGYFGSTVGHHHRQPLKAVNENGEKVFKMRHWMSQSKPAIFKEKDGFVEIANETFTGEIFMLALKKVK